MRKTCFAVGLLGIAVWTRTVAAQDRGEPRAQCAEQAPAALLRWAKHAAVPVLPTEPGQGFDDLRPLKQVIGNARVVGLGESLHAVHEFFEARHRLLEFLVEEMGFTAFAMETGFAESVKLHHFVLGRVDEPERWKDNWFTWGFGAETELLALVRWMRRYNADSHHERKIRFYGVDVPLTYSSPLAALQPALDYLDAVDPAYAGSRNRKQLVGLVSQFLGSGGGVRDVSLSKYKQLPPEARDAYTGALADLVARMAQNRPDYVSRSSEEAFAWAHRHATVAVQMDAGFRAAAEPDGLHPRLPRDRGMADNVLWVLEREGPAGRVVFWAHNTHVQKDRERSTNLSIPVGGVWTAGSYLASILGDEYVSIGFTYYQGAPAGWASYQASASEPAKCGTLDVEMTRVGLPMFVLDLRSAPAGPVRDWLERPIEQRENKLLHPIRAWDALFHIQHISPARREPSTK